MDEAVSLINGYKATKLLEEFLQSVAVGKRRALTDALPVLCYDLGLC